MRNETMNIVIQSLSERANLLSDLKRAGLTPSIRKAAEDDHEKTMKAWSEVEKLSYDMSVPPEVVYKDRVVNHVHVGEFENMKLHEIEKLMIMSALGKSNGKRKVAAEKLGISERTLYRKIIDYGLET